MEEAIMTLEEVIKHFGGVSQTARALGVTRQTIYHWRRKGEMPKVRSLQAMILIDGSTNK
jgi:DNA-binding phage protein